MTETITDPYPWVCTDGDHRYSITLPSKDAQAGGLLWDPRPIDARSNERSGDAD